MKSSREGRSWPQRAWYESARWGTTLVFATLGGGVRASGREHLPRSGAALLVSNHLSFLDVLILGLSVPRTLSYMARSSLFNPVLGPLIRSVNGFPIQRDGLGAEGLKETIRRLKAGGMVLVFPEGTRSINGELGAFRPGLVSLAVRTQALIQPAGVAGTFESWPRDQVLPRAHDMHIHYGPCLPPSLFTNRDAGTSLSIVRDSVLAASSEAKRRLQRRLQSDRPSLTA